MPPKTCKLDPIPASLLLDCIDEIVNACLSTGSLPDTLKQAIVKPLLKKPSLDPNILKQNKTNQTWVKPAFCVKTV